MLRVGNLWRVIGVLVAAAAIAATAHGSWPAGRLSPSGESDLIFADGFEAIPNRPPIADAGGDQSAFVGVSLVLDGSGSSDPDNDDLIYLWTVLDRPVNSGAGLFEPTHTFPTLIADREGDYVVQLIVFDGEFYSPPSTATISATGTLPDSALIGEEGGGVGLPDGAAILVPPGALDDDVTITIEEISPPPGAVLPPTGVYAGGVYALSPSGQAFGVPVQIIVPYDLALLPEGYTEGSVTIHRQGSGPDFHMLGSEREDLENGGHGQDLDITNRLVSAYSSTFSAYGALGLRGSSGFTANTLVEGSASIVVHQPPTLRTERPSHFNCNPNSTQVALATRIAADVRAVVIHSTNNGRPARDFEGELGWGANDCNPYFAHYYINRVGTIYQIVDDLLIALHTGDGAQPIGVTNTNAIGIELFNNVGEPYDGRQISALIHLLDFLAERYSIPRPSRNAGTGVFVRNATHIDTGGDRFVAHSDVRPNDKCDPSGTFRDSGQIKEEQVGIRCINAPLHALSVGNTAAPALIDVVLDTLVVLDRNGQHTGIVNTHGGDAFEFGQPGHGGSVTFREDATQVANEVGTAERVYWQENDPNLIGQPGNVIVGPGPLIVAPGGNVNLAGPMREYTDVVVAGTLNVDGPLELRLTGSFYVSPVGRIVVRTGRDGGNLTVYSRGIPIIQGLVDARGEDGVSGTPDGGHGGTIEFVFAAPGVLLAPTIYTRGGDADFANVTLPGGGPNGGDGGAVTIGVETSHVFLGGGIGPVLGGASVPPWRSGTIDPLLLDPPARWAGDFLPPPPPLTRSSIDVPNPAAGERVRKWTLAAQPGFKRGILTAGGMGGWGGNAPVGNRHGGDAGPGGAVQITLDPDALLTLRDVDIATGAEIESLRHRYQFHTGDFKVVCTAAGAHGGYSSNGGDGGAGGDAGPVELIGGTLNPTPSQFVGVYQILGFPPGGQMLVDDDNCSTGRVAIGNVLEARTSSGSLLYRVRLSGTGTSLLGGHGGIPSGVTSGGQPGVVGSQGTSALLTGLPVQ